MFKRIKRSMTPGRGIAFGVVFLIAATSAYAAIGSAGIKNNSIKSTDLKNNAAVHGRDVINNSLTGSDINETSLVGVVKTADFIMVSKNMAVGAADATLLTHGSITIKMSCAQEGANDILRIYAVTSANGAILETEDDDENPFDTTDLEVDSELFSESTVADVAESDTGYDETGYVLASNRTTFVNMVEGTSGTVINSPANTCHYHGAYFTD